MSTFIEIKKTALQFMKENINCYDVTVVKLERKKDYWHCIAEVYEDDSFLKAMNMPPKQVRMFYEVKIDDNLEITSFERLKSSEILDSSD